MKQQRSINTAVMEAVSLIPAKQRRQFTVDVVHGIIDRERLYDFTQTEYQTPNEKVGEALSRLALQMKRGERPQMFVRDKQKSRTYSMVNQSNKGSNLTVTKKTVQPLKTQATAKPQHVKIVNTVELFI